MRPGLTEPNWKENPLEASPGAMPREKKILNISQVLVISETSN